MPKRLLRPAASKLRVLYAALALLFLRLSGVAQYWGTKWTSSYDGAANSSDVASAVAFDSDGNTLVAGRSTSASTGLDVTLLKYDDAGNVVWERHYTGPGANFDSAEALAVDSAGNVYVGARKAQAAGVYDWAILKYDAAGTLLWDTPLAAGAYITAMAFDPEGNLLVTGATNFGSSSDYLTAKLDPSGTLLWTRTYNGPGNSEDGAADLAVDHSGNVVVTGTSRSASSESSKQFATVKYSPDGTELWVQREAGATADEDIANAVGVDAQGNVYVTGSSRQAGFIVQHDYLTVKYSSAGTLLRRIYYNNGSNDEASDISVAPDGTFVVTGTSVGFYNSTSSKDVLTRRYDTDGGVLWTHRYHNFASEEAIAAQQDSVGNIYVAANNSDAQWIALKYNAGGSLAFARSGPGALSGFNGFAVDLAGSGYVAATTGSFTSTQNFRTTKIVDGLPPSPSGSVLERLLSNTPPYRYEFRVIHSPNDAPTTVKIEYGLDTNYGSSVTASAGNGSDPVLSVNLVGNRTYHYRLVLTNAAGTYYSPDKLLSTPNTRPEARDDILHPPASAGAFALNVLTNDFEADQDALSISSVTHGSKGSVSIDGTLLTYTPGPDYDGNDTFSYAVSDGKLTDTATVTLRNIAPVAAADSALTSGGAVSIPVLSNDADGDGDDLAVAGFVNGATGSVTLEGDELIYTPSSAFPGEDSFTYTCTDGRGARSTATVIVRATVPITGIQSTRGFDVPNEPGAKFFKFGVPSFDGGHVGFQAVVTGDAGTLPVIYSGAAGGIVARRGDPAPGTAGAAFNSFREPVFGGGGTAFMATLKGGDTTSATDNGVWRVASGVSSMLAREGAVAPGTDGALWKTFISLGLPQAGGAVLVASLKSGSATVGSTNDQGIWREEAGQLRLLLREGQTLVVDGAALAVKSFTLLSNVSGSSGQRRSYSDTGALLLRVAFADGSQAVLRHSAGSASFEKVAASGDAITGSPAGAVFAKFGVPSLGPGSIAFVGTMRAFVGGVTPADDVAVFTKTGSAAFHHVAREGAFAPGTGGARFASFHDPALAGEGSVLFQARLARAEGLVSSSNDSGVWTNVSGELNLLAREGSQPPGVAGAQFASFLSCAVAENASKPIPLLVARMAVGPGGVTSRNAIGLWALDSSGDLRLITRTGDLVNVNGTAKTIGNLAVLGAVAGSPGQSRSYNGNRQLLYRATFTDGSQAVLRTRVP